MKRQNLKTHKLLFYFLGIDEFNYNTRQETFSVSKHFQ